MANRPIESLYRAIQYAVLAGMMFMLPSPARASAVCPWLNEATASGILGMPTVGVYVPSKPGKAAACTFRDAEAHPAAQLVISVEVVPHPQDRVRGLTQACRENATSLPAIGNEAMRCRVSARHGVHGERVIGRVRDQVFTITITTTNRKSLTLDEHELLMRSETAAEEVSGNLF